MQAENLDEKKWPPRVLSGVIQRWKDRGLTPEKVSDDEDLELPNDDFTDNDFEIAWKKFCELE